MTRSARKTRFPCDLPSRMGVSPRAQAGPGPGRGGVVESVGAGIPVEPSPGASPPTDSGTRITGNCGSVPDRPQGALIPAMKSFVDNVLVPALVRSYIAEMKCEKPLARDPGASVECAVTHTTTIPKGVET